MILHDGSRQNDLFGAKRDTTTSHRPVKALRHKGDVHGCRDAAYLRCRRLMVFDGKIGMWAVVKSVPALKSSRNRAADTLVTRSVNVGRK
ncbi:hypothetical protein ON010_g10494 [Phytophthora cinnamomi]|nr:hypothetical protein ON010_g10494 [Phytophthora cinnamomi]